MEGSKLLQTYIDRNSFITTIILTDNDGISICQASNEEQKNFVEKQGYMIFTAAFS